MGFQLVAHSKEATAHNHSTATWGLKGDAALKALEPTELRVRANP